MLDREEKTLSIIIEKIVDALLSKREIQPGDRDKVLQALMHKQRYCTHFMTKKDKEKSKWSNFSFGERF